MRTICCILTIASLFAGEYSAAAQAVPNNHPRLLGGDAEFALIRERCSTDPMMAAAAKGMADRAKAYSQAMPMVRVKEGKRMLKVSREALARIAYCAMDARINGNAVSRETAIRTMREVVAFEDWNPAHFLDVAEMSLGVALGYDWLYHDLSEDDRQTIADGLTRHGFKEMCREARKPIGSKLQKPNNWGQVCSAGSIAVSLALWYEEQPEARELLKAAVSGMRVPMAVYAPKGGYPEGPGYWEYGTDFNVIGLGLLEHALGTDYGLAKAEGFLESGAFRDWTTGPTGDMFNYSDSGLTRTAATAPWWFAAHGAPTCVDFFERTALMTAAADSTYELPRTFPCALFWMLNATSVTEFARPRVWTSDDPTGLVVLRTSWTTNAWFASFKGGYVGANHGHLDAGSFVFEAEGVRWAGDLGPEGYGKAEAAGIDLWNMGQESGRWKLYRLSNRSHNVLYPDGVLQNVGTTGHVLAAADNGDSLETTLELDAVYAPVLEGWRRQARLTDKSFEITDSVSCSKGVRLNWGFTTYAKAEVRDKMVVLTENGRAMAVEVAGVDDLRWKVGPAEGGDPNDSPNPGWTRVSFSFLPSKHHCFTVSFRRLAQTDQGVVCP